MTTSFENSSMKSSFSLSSLRTAPAQNGGRNETMERAYHSLTKKRKEPSREAWRRSWGSAASGGSCGDDLWPLLQHHYEYIMDNQIINTCKEANGELSSNALLPPLLSSLTSPLASSSSYNRQWSLAQFVAEFTELCQWLSTVQEEIYSSPENLANKNLRMTRMTELGSIEHRRIKFVEQASAISERIPEANGEVTWRLEHLNTKWEGLRLLLNPEGQPRDGDTEGEFDSIHELRCLRRWLHIMEGRLPPPSMTAARAAPPHEILRKLQEHQVLQHDVECHGRIVSSVVRLCGGGDAAKALERRWHLLYLRAIEWQCHLEACLTKIEKQRGFSDPASDSDEEPVLKQPRLTRRGSPRRALRPLHVKSCTLSPDSRQSCSEEEQDSLKVRSWYGSRDNMADERCDQTVPSDVIDGHLDLDNQVETPIDESKLIKTPPTVIKRKKPINTSKFNQTDRKSKLCATFYFRHHDTDSDKQMIDTEKSQEESSEEEWTYVNSKIANEDSTDLMTSSVEIQCDLPLDDKTTEQLNKLMESTTPDLLRVENSRSKDIERLVMQAEELVQKQAQAQLAKQKVKSSRNLIPLMFEEQGGSVNRSKISRIKEWLNQSSDGKSDDIQGLDDRYDASGEYTTESEMDTSLTSEERNIHSSMDMSTSTCTVTPTHHAKVQLRKKRSTTSARPWSMACLSQLSAGASLTTTPTSRDVTAMRTNMSISESALNTLSGPHGVTPSTSNSKLRGSNTTVQGHISSTNTMTEACTSCVEASDKQCWLRRKRLKFRRRQLPNNDRMVKSLSFCGLSPEPEDKVERSAASDPATSRKNRFDTTSTSGNDSDEELRKQQLAAIAYLRKSIEKTHISTTLEQGNSIPEQMELEQVTPSFKLGPAGGFVRPRFGRSTERERTLLAISLGDPGQLYDLGTEKDSDVDRSINTGTEEHSSFSEQAWDFYQEKYNSEPYSEAPDSDAARRLLDFGDDYRVFLDSQSDCCSSVSAHPDPPRYKRPYKPQDTPQRKPKKPLSSAERKKTLLDSLERSRNNTSIESNEGVRRRKPSESSDRKNSKRSPDAFELLNMQALLRRRQSMAVTSDEINSSLEYNEVNNRPDIIDSLHRRRRNTHEFNDGLNKRDWSGGSESEIENQEIQSLIKRSTAQLEHTEGIMDKSETSPDLLRGFDYVRNFGSNDDLSDFVTQQSNRLRAKLCMAVAAFSVMVIVYIHLQ